MDKITARKQIGKLLLLDSAGSFMIAGASWVALLAARGFSTVEIGFAESIFHVASMLFEIPSGAVADVFGRKRTMVAGRLMAILATVLMILSEGFFSVAISMVFSAFSYNLASGTREALAYDSLREAGIENEYDKFASNDMVIYQVTTSLATLMAGVALMLGYRRAYLVDAVIGCGSVWIAASLREAKTELSNERSIKKRFYAVVRESAAFLKSSKKARGIIMFNALIGAVAVLVLFFLQAKLTEFGIEKIWLGPALFLVGLGSAIGAKAVTCLPHIKWKEIGLFSVIGVMLAVLSVFTGNCMLVIIGGFIGAFADSFLSVRTDVVLNTMIPSDQRATLVSVNSFAYSVVMIVLSPLFGVLFL